MYNRQSDHYNDPINQNIDFFGHAGIFIKRPIVEQTLEAIGQRQQLIKVTPPYPLFSKKGEKKLRGGRVRLRIHVSESFDVWTILRPLAEPSDGKALYHSSRMGKQILSSPDRMGRVRRKALPLFKTEVVRP